MTQNSMDLLQKCLHFEALTDVYILKPHLNLTYLLISNVKAGISTAASLRHGAQWDVYNSFSELNSGLVGCLQRSPGRADGLVGCLQRFSGMSTTAHQVELMA